MIHDARGADGELEEQFSSLLADFDDKLATECPADTAAHGEIPAEIRPWLDREVEWFRKVRRLLRGDQSTVAYSAVAAGPVAHAPRTLGRFHIRRELGRGGFGVVYLAHDPKLGREVALKVPRPEVLVDASLRARFQQEARAAAGLDHPNLVAVYEAGADGAVCYIASAYCPGTTLYAWLKARTEPVPFDMAARLLASLADAVEHAHRRGILHRDLKPSNVMLSPLATAGNSAVAPLSSAAFLEFTPRIMDFGLAKVLQDGPAEVEAVEQTQTGAVVGTPAYMAPEQAGGKKAEIGPATDVYALGVILYEMLTGRAPFRGEDAVETLLQVRTQEPLAPRRLRAKMPRDLETICLKCLHKEPRKRYATAQALADDLGRYLAKQPILARRVSTIGRFGFWCRRNPALAGAIAAVVVASGVGLWRVIEERDRYRAERDRAQAHLLQACQAVDQMLTRVGSDRLVQVPQLMTVRRDLFEDAVKFYEELARQEPDDPQVRAELGRAYRRLGLMYSGTFREMERAERTLQKALALADELATEFPAVPDFQRDLADCEGAVGLAYYGAQKSADAERHVRGAIAARDKLIAMQPDVPDHRAALAIDWDSLGVIYAQLSRWPEAGAAFDKSVDMLEKLAAENHAGFDCRSKLAVCLFNQGCFLAMPKTNRSADARAVFTRTIGIWQELLERNPADPFARMRLALTFEDLAELLVTLGQPGQAEEQLNHALKVRQSLVADHPNVPYFHMRLGGTYHALAERAQDRGDLQGASQHWESAIQEQREGMKAEMDRESTRKALRASLDKFAQVKLRLGDRRVAAKAATEMADLAPGAWQGLYRAGYLLAGCASAAAKDSALPAEQRNFQAQAYAGQAVQFFAQAIDKGYRDLPALSQDPDLQVLRSRADFQQLISDLAAKSGSGK